MEPEDLEDEAYNEAYNDMMDEHVKYGERAYGKEAMDHANIGWVVEEDEDGAYVASKVYGHGIVTTYYDPATCKVVSHEHEDF